ncbi:hypothetical protein [Methanosarcina barkeri]|nr:hypothetical protein [Methanosarcina barkeri]
MANEYDVSVIDTAKK